MYALWLDTYHKPPVTYQAPPLHRPLWTLSSSVELLTLLIGSCSDVQHTIPDRLARGQHLTSLSTSSDWPRFGEAT